MSWKNHTNCRAWPSGSVEPVASKVRLKGGAPEKPEASVLAFGGLITLSTLAAFVWALGRAPDRAPTIAFMTLALAQIAHLGNARSRGPVLRLGRALANPYALAGAGLAVLLQLGAAIIDPLARILRVTPLDGTEWVVVIALASIPALAGQGAKVYRAVSLKSDV